MFSSKAGCPGRSSFSMVLCRCCFLLQSIGMPEQYSHISKQLNPISSLCRNPEILGKERRIAAILVPFISLLESLIQLFCLFHVSLHKFQEFAIMFLIPFGHLIFLYFLFLPIYYLTMIMCLNIANEMGQPWSPCFQILK